MVARDARGRFRSGRRSNPFNYNEPKNRQRKTKRRGRGIGSLLKGIGKAAKTVGTKALNATKTGIQKAGQYVSKLSPANNAKKLGYTANPKGAYQTPKMKTWGKTQLDGVFASGLRRKRAGHRAVLVKAYRAKRR